MTWMIYGANGYTGELIAEHAVESGERPVLAGRRREAVEPLARRLDCDFRVFPLDEPEHIAEHLGGISTILLAAGPFSRTSAQVRGACRLRQIHYLDITGEIDVLEACFEEDEQNTRAGCVFMPGVGFDVVPTDCLAVSLSQDLLDATLLEIVIETSGLPSRGTAKTMLEAMGQGSIARIEGDLGPLPEERREIKVRLRDREHEAIAIPWGDISTAYRSTSIPNIATYLVAPLPVRLVEHFAPKYAGILNSDLAQSALSKLADLAPRGPGQRRREKGHAHIWGRVSDNLGHVVERRLETSEMYTLTSHTAVECVRRVEADELEPVTTTPATAFGPSFIETFSGCRFLND